MIYDFISVFALVLGVYASVAAAWIIYDLKQQMRAQASWRSTYESYVKSLRVKLDAVQKESPTELAARVVELGDAVGRLAKTQQRFQGRFDQYVNPEPPHTHEPTAVDRDELRRRHANDILPAGLKR